MDWWNVCVYVCAYAGLPCVLYILGQCHCFPLLSKQLEDGWKYIQHISIGKCRQLKFSFLVELETHFYRERSQWWPSLFEGMGHWIRIKRTMNKKTFVRGGKPELSPVHSKKVCVPWKSALTGVQQSISRICQSSSECLQLEEIHFWHIPVSRDKQQPWCWVKSSVATWSVKVKFSAYLLRKHVFGPIIL